MRATKIVALVEPGPCRTWWVRIGAADHDTQVAAEIVPPGAAAGSCWTARVDIVEGAEYVLKFLGPLASEPSFTVPRRRSELVPAAPARVEARFTWTVERGDIVCVSIRFTNHAGGKDACLTEKVRPSIIVGIRDSRLDLRPVYDRAGYQARCGARPLKDWYRAGLHKPSVVAPSIVTVPRNEIVSKVGRITSADRWLFDEAA